MKNGYKSDNKNKEILIKEQLSFWENSQKNKIYKKKFLKIYIGDINKVLNNLQDNLADCIITSPPYWKQRDYKDKNQIGQENSYFEYISKLTDIFNKMKRILKPTGTFFLNIGYKYHEKELLMIPDLLAIEMQKNGWALLNKIIWFKQNAMPSSFDKRFSNVHEPIFLFVKKENKYNYYFSLDNLRIPARDWKIEKKPEEIIGLEVKNSLNRDQKSSGFVSKLLKDKNKNLFAEVLWQDGKRALNIIQDFKDESQIFVPFLCDKCFKKIHNEIDVADHNNCDGFPKPIFNDKVELNNLQEIVPKTLFPLERTRIKKKEYNGKFLLSPENRGASPGARKSLFGEYFVLQRRYKIYQPMIANYLRFWREKKGISVKEIDKILCYKDTAGHWFRKDSGSWGKGGSIPLPDDWLKLKEILNFDDTYDKLLTEKHLVLQTVKAHPKGKNPGDVWNIKLKPFPEAHFAVFPEELVKKCIEAGCPEEGTILDPFAGSGTVGKVAEEMGRNAVLIELIPEYLDIMRKRCQKISEVIYVR